MDKINLSNLKTITGVPASEISARLAEPFPKEAYKKVPSKTYLTDISTGYMMERIDEVFGLRGLGWRLDYDPEDMVIYGLDENKPTNKQRPTAHLRYAKFVYVLVDNEGNAHEFSIIVSGASSNDIEYGEEGARTAAIGGALKVMGFQKHIYKNQSTEDAQRERRSRNHQPEPEDDDEDEDDGLDDETREALITAAAYTVPEGVGLPFEGKTLGETIKNGGKIGKQVIGWLAGTLPNNEWEPPVFMPESEEDSRLGEAAKYLYDFQWGDDKV